jgi:uncharacterized membrane protein YgdD (TMEM256/DUF423 family)
MFAGLPPSIFQKGADMAERRWWMIGAMAGLLGVLAGAFGSHGLKDHASPALQLTWETAARYQMYHALGLLAVAWASTRWPGKLTTAAGWLFTAGILIFCGSLYVLVLGEIRHPDHWKKLGMITPIGGLSFMAGWVALFLAAWRDRSR